MPEHVIRTLGSIGDFDRLTIGLLIVTILMFEYNRVQPDSVVVAFAAMMNLGICGACHMIVGLRAAALASR